MKCAFVPIGLVFGCVFLAGCGANYDGPKRFPVAGRVTFNGEPVDRGSITFLPQGDGDSQRVSGGGISDGTYSVPEEKGPTAGKYRIEVHWSKKTGKMLKTQYGEDEPEMVEAIPGEFNTDSTLTVDVSAENTKLDFDLKSDKKTPAQKSKIVTDYGS